MNRFDTYLQTYLEHCKYRKRLDDKTLKAYAIDLNQFRNYCSSFHGSNYDSRNTMEQFVTFLHKQYKPKTVKRKIASLKAFFHYLEYIEVLSANPFSKLDFRFREPKLLPRTIPAHTIQTFLNTLYSEKEHAASNYQQNCCIRDIAIIELLFATGIRISELCTLKSENIDFENNTILIYGKGSKERILQIGNPDVLEALNLYRKTFQQEIKECGYFFVNRLHNRLSDQSVRYMINHYALLAGIEQHITPHMFRHSFATLLLEQNVDIRYIQRILGHSSINTTEIYTHVSNIKQKDILFHKHPRNLMEIHKTQ